uniref:Trypsin-like serine protease n=1 Tax=Phenylobacterium glaciei TaxID=2803784 RepID=A0A974P1C0_9CAUL|nr:trypsin-like serine protease [Phenylobacterium glaciei]
MDLRDWAAVAVTDVDSEESCTLTLVGPAVVLLAAHCVDAGYPPGTSGEGTIGGKVVFGSQGAYQLRHCGMPAAYKQWTASPVGAPRSSADYALCELDHKVSGVAPESIRYTASVAVGVKIRLMGSGCIDLGISDTGDYIWKDGKRLLRMGYDSVEATGISLLPTQPGLYLRTLSSGSKEPVLCFGDSGGPVTLDVASGGRRVVAVNSGVGATNTATPKAPAFYSYLSPLAAADFQAFLLEWAGPATPDPLHPAPAVRIICGYNRPAGIQGCRS